MTRNMIDLSVHDDELLKTIKKHADRPGFISKSMLNHVIKQAAYEVLQSRAKTIWRKEAKDFDKRILEEMGNIDTQQMILEMVRDAVSQDW